MRKVLHLRTVNGQGGGPEKTILLSPRFLGPEYCARLVYIRPKHDPQYNLPERARQMGVDLVDIPERSGWDPATIIRLAREIRAYRPDLLHPHDYKTNLLGLLLGRWFGIPVVTTAHGYGLLGGRLDFYCRLDRWTMRRVAHCIAVSDDLVETLESFGVPSDRISLIENAIDTEHYRRRKPPAAARESLGLRPERFLVGAVGRLQHEKGFDVLIQAAARLLAKGLDFDLIIAGDGPLKADLGRLISELGQKDRIHLLGYRSDLIELFQAMDLFVLSSLREALPNVLLEAMALEVPSVATAVGGVPRMIEHGGNGLLISPGEVGPLEQAIEYLLGDQEKRIALARAGRATVEERYSFRRRMEKVKAVYDRVLGPEVVINNGRAGQAFAMTDC